MPPDSSRNFAMVFLTYLDGFAKSACCVEARPGRFLPRRYGKSATFSRFRRRGEAKVDESKGAIE
jgi:hypothetical protein